MDLPKFWSYPPYFTCVGAPSQRSCSSGVSQPGMAPCQHPQQHLDLPSSAHSMNGLAVKHTSLCARDGRLQPVAETREKQISLWHNLLLNYCKHHKASAPTP